MQFAFSWFLVRGLFLASAEAVEIDRVLSRNILVLFTEFNSQEHLIMLC